LFSNCIVSEFPSLISFIDPFVDVAYSLMTRHHLLLFYFANMDPYKIYHIINE